MSMRRRRSPSAGIRAKKVPAPARLRMANAERHAELDPTGHTGCKRKARYAGTSRSRSAAQPSLTPDELTGETT